MTVYKKPKMDTSPLSGQLTSEGVTLDVQIYRVADSNERWVLEVIDEHRASTVWDDSFATDRDAYAEFYRTLESDGAGSFFSRSKDSHESLKDLAMTKHFSEREPIRPLTKEEREARKAFRQIEAEVAMSDHEATQKAFSDNRERLKAERIARDAAQSSETEPKTAKPVKTTLTKKT